MFEPFVTPSLKQVPFNSRIGSQYALPNNKNYFLLGFNPGYALQASELNEIQELFFMNSSLTQRMNANWSDLNYKIPFWSGLIPLSPSQIEITDVTFTSTNVSFVVAAENGWYLWTNPESQMSHWIYKQLSADDTSNKVFTMPLSSTRYIGYVTKSEIITCCPDDTCESTEDDTLRDNSSGDYTQHNTCGASRLKFSIEDDTDSFEIRSSTFPTLTFRPIIEVTSTTTTLSAYFINGQEIPVSV